ncbi:MAG: Ig-like domain-containing protein, partial [Candidatus Subteraquimicrobiales bacterium]|nr:Ig-like domain-containing protein [Candidatus Subteraquimicrobiales bacterium]
NTTTVSDGVYTIKVTTTDLAGNTSSASVTVNVDNTLPTSAITDPTASAYIKGSKAIIGTASDTNFQKYDLKYGAGASPTVWYDIGTNPHTTAVSNGTLDTWNTTTVSDGVYTIKVTTTDLAGNTSFASVTVNVDNTAPTVTSTIPASNASGVSPSTTVKATFSEDIDGATITTSTFTLKTGETSVSGTTSYDAGTKTATFTPSASLAKGTAYTATLTTGVKDKAGNPLAASYSWNFVTEYDPSESKYSDGAIDADSAADPATWTDSDSLPELTDNSDTTLKEIRENVSAADKWFYVKYNADASQYSSVKIKIKIDYWDSTTRSYKFEIRAYSTLTAINTSAEAKVVSDLYPGTATKTWYTVDVTTAAHTMDGKGWMKFRVWLNEHNGLGNDQGYASECRFDLTQNLLTVSHTPPAGTNINQGTTNTVINVLNLSASGGTITVNSIKVDRTGTSADSDVSLVKLIDDANG